MNQELINKYDSDFCGNLPIHLINVLQAYGAILVIDKASATVIQVSENLGPVLGRPFAELPGRAVSEFLDREVLFGIRGTAPRVWEIAGRKYLAILHDKPSYCILEINLESAAEAASDPLPNLYHEFRGALESMERADAITQAASVAARELKRISGFDKVMIYRFDDNWNGFVIAEEMEAGMESYLGFTFPASDIPRQARELYLKNPYRLIPDRDYTPVKLYPFINPATDMFIDLSDCNVRGVTLVHLEYLKNMQVTASMSTGIIKDGKLWGLIACHHRTAMTANYKMCAAFEFWSGIIANKIAALEYRDRQAASAFLSAAYTALVEETVSGSAFADAFLSRADTVIDLFHAGGAVISYRGKVYQKGAVPSQASLEDLLLWLDSRGSDQVYHTDNLSKDYDYAQDFHDVGSGLMVIPIHPENSEYVLVFRPEVIRHISWGGNPEGRINFEEDLRTYHPRFSFKLWQEKVTGISHPWLQEEIETAENLRQFLREFLDKEKIYHR